TRRVARPPVSGIGTQPPPIHHTVCTTFRRDPPHADARQTADYALTVPACISPAWHQCLGRFRRIRRRGASVLPNHSPVGRDVYLRLTKRKPRLLPVDLA